MSAFEFFFSLFGLILGLAIATIAGGMSDVLRERKRIPIGLLTPLMATFLLIDLTSFWVVSWQSLSEIRIGFPSMLSVVSLAVVYVFAAGMVLPKKVEEWASVDEYYLQHYRWVLGGVLFANIGLLTLVGALSDEGVLGSWLNRLFRWQDMVYFGVLIVLMIFPRRIVHLVGYAILLFGYVAIVVTDPSLT
ncbi:hypothetical protein [Terricaulis silvestris]|uniref:Uncharacterized protein n=1 Tax=Terricaulis silvestris TaxID=2686094 RepID=A0A6I6MN15_9CAUL|nr:hypothetical protein [Terricaulis silvestris]QGZ94127.1 hypothetical protein DSM104635_00943 [Terricaulis silvestris]